MNGQKKGIKELIPKLIIEVRLLDKTLSDTGCHKRSGIART